MLMHKTLLEFVTYFEETDPLYREETLSTQRYHPEAAPMTLPVQIQITLPETKLLQIIICIRKVGLLKWGAGMGERRGKGDKD